MQPAKDKKHNVMELNVHNREEHANNRVNRTRPWRGRERNKSLGGRSFPLEAVHHKIKQNLFRKKNNFNKKLEWEISKPLSRNSIQMFHFDQTEFLSSAYHIIIRKSSNWRGSRRVHVKIQNTLREIHDRHNPFIRILQHWFPP